MIELARPKTTVTCCLEGRAVESLLVKLNIEGADALALD